MPRTKPGLGQGLDALMAARSRAGSAPHQLTPVATVTLSDPRWEFAVLAVPRNKKRRLRLRVSHPDPAVVPRTRRLRRVPAWTALGVLGAEGWELVAVQGRRYYFKRTAGRM